jgi:hypothetical protein
MVHHIMNPPHNDESFIPHQLHITTDKAKKIMKGLPVIIPHSHMGSGVGHHIIMLKPQNARKLLTSYKKGKGMKMHLTPHEIHHTIHHGRGFFDIAKKIYHGAKETVKSALKNPVINDMASDAVHYGSDAVGTAVGTFFGNPMAGLAVGELLGRAGEHAIKSQKVDTGTRDNTVSGTLKGQAKELAFDAIHNKIDELPKEYRDVAKKALQGSFDISEAKKAYDNTHGGSGLYGGGKLKKGSKEAKAFMASIRKKKKGGDINWDPLHVGDKLRDAGNQIKDTFTDVGNKIVQGVNDVGHAVVGGVDHLGNDIKGAVSPVITSVKDIVHYPDLLNAVKNNPKLINDMMTDLKTVGHYVIPATLGALGGMAGTELGGPLGGIAGSSAGSYAGTQINKKLGIDDNTTFAGMGIKRSRGRPKKGMGIASESMVFKRALRNNFNGLTLANYQVNNAPIRDFHTNPHVKPSSLEMTLSPYQSNSSPAMNPFVPTNYAQMGGTSCGYGGKGLHNKFGHSRHMVQPIHGVGLYGP